MNTRTNLEVLLRAIFPNVNQAKNSYLESAKEELELLALEATEDEIYAMANIIKSAPDLTGAIKKVEGISLEDISSLASEEKKSVGEHANERRRQADEQRRLDKEKDAERVQLAKQITKELIEALPSLRNMVYVEYQDYTVVARAGDDITDLREPVLDALKQGWTLIGGIHVAGPIPNGTLLFTQALGFPKGPKKPKRYDF